MIIMTNAISNLIHPQVSFPATKQRGQSSCSRNIAWFWLDMNAIFKKDSYMNEILLNRSV